MCSIRKSILPLHWNKTYAFLQRLITISSPNSLEDSCPPSLWLLLMCLNPNISSPLSVISPDGASGDVFNIFPHQNVNTVANLSCCTCLFSGSFYGLVVLALWVTWLSWGSYRNGMNKIKIKSRKSLWATPKGVKGWMQARIFNRALKSSVHKRIVGFCTYWVNPIRMGMHMENE